MRYVTLQITSEGVPLHGISRSALPDGVGRGSIHGIELLADGSAVLLRSVAGDLAAYEGALAGTPGVHAVSVAGRSDGHAFIHFEPTDAVRSLIEWRRRFPVVVRMPIEFEGDVPIVTLVGAVADFADATASLPAGLDYEVRGTGRYVPGKCGPFHGLTERQREILATAVDCGYYENPREATQADVAATLSLSPGTVGDHLRTIEAHVFSGRSVDTELPRP